MSSQLNLSRALPPLVGAGLYLILWFVVPDELRLWVLAVGGAIVLLVTLASLVGLPAPTDAGFPGVLTPFAAAVAIGAVLGTLPATEPSAPDEPVPVAGPGTPAPPAGTQACSTTQPKDPLVQYGRSLQYDKDRQHHPRRWDAKRLAQQPPPGGPFQPGPRAAIYPQLNAHNNTPEDLASGRIVAEVFIEGNEGYPDLNLPPRRSWIMICASSTETSGYVALIIPESANQQLRDRPVSVFVSAVQEPAASARFNENETPPGIEPSPNTTVAAVAAGENGCVTCKISGWCYL